MQAVRRERGRNRRPRSGHAAAGCAPDGRLAVLQQVLERAVRHGGAQLLAHRHRRQAQHRRALVRHLWVCTRRVSGALVPCTGAAACPSHPATPTECLQSSALALSHVAGKIRRAAVTPHEVVFGVQAAGGASRHDSGQRKSSPSTCVCRQGPAKSEQFWWDR